MSIEKRIQAEPQRVEIPHKPELLLNLCDDTLRQAYAIVTEAYDEWETNQSSRRVPSKQESTLAS